LAIDDAAIRSGYRRYTATIDVTARNQCLRLPGIESVAREELAQRPGAIACHVVPYRVCAEVFPLRHPEPAREAGRQPLGEPEMIGMRMGGDDPVQGGVPQR